MGRGARVEMSSDPATKPGGNLVERLNGPQLIMIIREFRRGDSVGMEALWQSNGSEEFSLFGVNSAGIGKVLQRLERRRMRFLLGITRAVGRPVLAILVLEQEGKILGTVVLHFEPHAGVVSSLTVDQAVRRRGCAGELLKRCEDLGKRYRKSHLVLDVLANNSPAVRLYEKFGFRTIRQIRWLAKDLAGGSEVAPVTGSFGLRPFRNSDAKPLTRLANEAMPEGLAMLVGQRPKDFLTSRLGRQLAQVERKSWVLEWDRCVLGYARATVSPVLQAAQLGPLVLGGDVEEDPWEMLITEASDWCSAKGLPRATLSLPDHLDKCLPLLARLGWVEEFRVQTMALGLHGT